MEIQVEKCLLDYVQTLSTLIGQIISRLTNDADSDVTANFLLLLFPSFTLNRVIELSTCCQSKRLFENVKCATTTSQSSPFLVKGNFKMYLKLRWLDNATNTFSEQTAIIFASVKFWSFCSYSCFKALGRLSFFSRLWHLNTFNSLRTFFSHLFTTEICNTISSLAVFSRRMSKQGYGYIWKSLPIL